MNNEARRVFDLKTGSFLGYASDTLAETSDAAGETGAVEAYQDDEGLWQDVIEGSRVYMSREVRTVFVER